ncbi:MAG: nucleoside:proton symporter [Rhodospirillaceae bacterium]|nr:nucleoside:proton symporter [Rhodospirillaceae bacterium]
MPELQSAFGLVVLFALAWAVGEKRRRSAWRVALAGIGLQIALALILLKVPLIADLVASLGHVVTAMEQATREGTSMVFGYIGGGALPFTESRPGAAFVFAFQALPIIIVTSTLTALLTHWRILPWIVKGIGLVLERGFRIGGAVGLGSAANIFIGMVEAPLFVRPYLKDFSRSELFVLMTVGMATIAGTVFVLYASILAPVLPNAAGQILVASVISAPAAIAVALLMVPPDGPPQDSGSLPPRETSSAMEALVVGARQGLNMLFLIVAMLIALVALVHLANGVLALLPDVAGEAVTLQKILALVMTPLCWLMGIPWAECWDAAQLMATKVVLNELVSYLDLARLPEGTLGERSRLILVYAMCGFANFGGLGIMVGGLTVLMPERRNEILALSWKSLAAGVLATSATGCVIGILG